MPKYISAKFDPDTVTVDYVADDGSHLLRTGGTIPWRFNNPGNIRPPRKRKVTTHIGAGTTKSGEFLIFPTYEAGRAELKRLLTEVYSGSTIVETINKYAPPNENDTEQYIDFVCKKASVNRDDQISSLNEGQLIGLMDAIEKIEGYHNKKDTRQEKIVNTTTVTLSDGAKPLANQQVTIKANGKSQTVSTNKYGQLPAIPHTKEGGTLEILVNNIKGELEQIGSLALGSASAAYTFVKGYFEVQAQTRPVAGTLGKKQKPDAVRYRVEPGDTLGKIAKKFKTTVDQIKADNKSQIRNVDKVYPGEVLYIHGPNPEAGPTAKAATSKTKSQTKTVTPPKEKKIVASPARSQEGEGRPLALVPADQKSAPWMEVALTEAKFWHGQTEDVIGKTRNFHKETGATFLESLVGTNNAWCASFVNYCLQQTGYRKWKNSFRARAVALDTTNFVEIDKPIYGAIALIGTHHATLVYAKDKNSKYMICLGGNQHDQINFTVFKESTRYFVPVAYHEYAKQELISGKLESFTADELNKAIGIKVIKKKGHATR